MHFHILTLFPEMVMNGLCTSITGRAVKNGYITIEATNIRDFSNDKHGHVDDYPYGGGAGMVMKAEPVYEAYQHVKKQIMAQSGPDARTPRVIYMTPQGRVFDQDIAKELSEEENLVFLCGHYEGIDERVLDMVVTDNISIGDYVLTGGELPAMVMIDAIARLVPGVLNNDVSAEFETFHDHLLEYPQYTRPETFMGQKVPSILLSGDHKKVDEWRLEQSVIRTRENRPDLYELWLKEHPDEKGGR